MLFSKENGTKDSIDATRNLSIQPASRTVWKNESIQHASNPVPKTYSPPITAGTGSPERGVENDARSPCAERADNVVRVSFPGTRVKQALKALSNAHITQTVSLSTLYQLSSALSIFEECSGFQDVPVEIIRYHAAVREAIEAGHALKQELSTAYSDWAIVSVDCESGEPNATSDPQERMQGQQKGNPQPHGQNYPQFHWPSKWTHQAVEPSRQALLVHLRYEDLHSLDVACCQDRDPLRTSCSADDCETLILATQRFSDSLMGIVCVPSKVTKAVARMSKSMHEYLLV